MNKKVERNSSIEALKIFAIIIIVFSHAAPSDNAGLAGYMNLSLATESIQRLIILFMKYGGQVGNAIFIICSAWFLVDSKKMNVKKIAIMAIDSFVISVGSMLAFSAMGVDLTTKEVIKQFFSLTFQHNWFVVCYICYYLTHTFINKITEDMTQKTLLYVTSLMFAVYCCLSTLSGGKFYSSSLVQFITIHIIITYIKRYMPNACKNKKLNIGMLLFSSLGLIALVLVTNYLGLHIGFFNDKMTRWCTFINPLILMFATSAFNLCNRRTYCNKAINYLSGLTLYIYMIHENYIIRNYVKGMIFERIYETYTYQYELAWVCLYGVALGVYGVVMAVIYRNTIQRLTKKFAGWLCQRLGKLFGGLADIVIKIVD